MIHTTRTSGSSSGRGSLRSLLPDVSVETGPRSNHEFYRNGFFMGLFQGGPYARLRSKTGNGVSLGSIANVLQATRTNPPYFPPYFNGVALAAGINIGYLNGVGVGLVGNELWQSNGLLIGSHNSVMRAFCGVAIGLYNSAKTATGAMFGLVNVVDSESAGVFIGLLNIRTDAPWYSRYIPGIAVRWRTQPDVSPSAPIAV